MDWTTVSQPLRLAAGVSVIPTADGFLLATPDEDFITIEVEAGRRDLVASLLAGELAPDVAVAQDPDAAGLLDALAEEHLFADEQRSPAGPVVLLGDGLLVEQLSSLLHAKQTDDIHAAAVVVACADWLPDARWRELDAECAAAGIAWHRGYAEGARWYAGPLSIPGRGPTYLDLRLRRLAASPWPDQLLSYWSWLDAGGRPAAGSTPDPAGAAVVAGLIAADVRAYLAGRPVPGERVQYGVDIAAGVVRRHPVLPIPVGLMVEAP